MTRRFDRGSAGRRPQVSPHRRSDSDRMPPPGARRNLGGGRNDRNTRNLGSKIRSAPASASDVRNAQVRRKLAEKHVNRRPNTGREIVAKRIRLAKMRR